MESKVIIRLALLFIVCFTQLIFASKVILKSDQLFFDETLNQVHASGFVELSSDDFSIKASSLSFNLDSGIVTSTENVNIKRKDQQFDSSSLVLNLQDAELLLEDIHVAVELPNKKGQIYIKVKDLIDKSTMKVGHNASFTTCSFEHPHHYLKAWRMHYYPEKRVDLYMAVLVNNLSFFPFTVLPPVPLLEWVPLPVYSYHLGKRNIIWNFPTIGKKKNESWGWFVQNKIDFYYANNKESSVLVDWYQTKGDRQGNWGGGVDVNYGNEKNFGSVYAYNYDFIEGTGANAEEKNNSIYSIDQTVTWDKLKLNGRFKTVDVDERINSSGSDDYQESYFSSTYSPDAFPFFFSFMEKQQKKQKYQLQQSKLTKEGLHYKSSFIFNETNYDSSQRYVMTSSLSHAYELPRNIKMTHKLELSQNDYKNDEEAIDERLKTYTTLKSKLPNDIDLTVKFDYFLDLDEERVTSDASNNNFLFRLPEIELKKKAKLYNFDSNSTVRFGWYKENRYSSSDDELAKFPFETVGAQPNVYYFKQGLSRTVKDLPMRSKFYISTEYEQYLFKNEGYNIFEGDAQYNIRFKSSLSSDINHFLKIKSEYESRSAPDENNSPFYEFRKNIYQINKVSESLILYRDIKRSDKFKHDIYLEFSNKAGYNWLNDTTPWSDLQMAALMRVNKRHQLKLTTSQKLNFTASEKDTKYSPLLIDLDLKGKKGFIMDYFISYDLNDINRLGDWNVERSYVTFKVPIGEDKDFSWYFNTYLKYENDGAGKPLDLNYYEIQSFSVSKNEHKRVVELGYKRQGDEVYFKYTFTIFPDDPFVLRRVNDIWTFEGRLKGSSKERFK